VSGNTEVLTEPCDGPPLLIEAAAFGNIARGQYPVASQHTGRLDMSHDRRAANIKQLGERIGRLPHLVTLDELRNFVNGQSALLLTERSDRSMGHRITALTRENAL
jgi:hypothetical protein